METTTTVSRILVFRVAPTTTCHLCGAPLSNVDCPLCPECEREEDAKWHDYLADREAARWPY